ncbi:MarR family winged helix-turn-helix transcriptional regulator [Nocardia vinacea]|uniref:MarR family winged helix-turn-helix transcriptional regulator n=1 Tax=Nocardia vinacea TaxID=96468 RepID=UPI001C3F432C|nr:MarR family winged helix-turn-helix transcriptional regulator [Nocardia vinacea]
MSTIGAAPDRHRGSPRPRPEPGPAHPGRRSSHGRAADSDQATVSTVADQLGLDHSGASRMVRDAVAAGYLTRVDSAHDRRRVVLKLTDNGRDLLAGSCDWQRRCFDQPTTSWHERDHRQSAAYLQRLADETTTHP